MAELFHIQFYVFLLQQYPVVGDRRWLMHSDHYSKGRISLAHILTCQESTTALSILQCVPTGGTQRAITLHFSQSLLKAYILHTWPIVQYMVTSCTTPHRKWLKEAQTMYQSITTSIKSHKLVGSLWVHTDTIGCVVLIFCTNAEF